MPSEDPKKYNIVLTDEVMRQAAVTAARAGIKLLEEPVFDAVKLTALGVFIDGCTGGMLFPDGDKDALPDFDND